jgi:ABC-type Fe3+-hydroxamate transport system substrate-binding protein
VIGRAVIRLPTLLIVSLARRCDNVERPVRAFPSRLACLRGRTAVLAFGVLLLAACERTGGGSTQDDGEPETPPVVVDAAGREHPTDALPARIVSLVPAATGILTDLGAGARIAGRTDADTASALSSLPSVGGAAPDLAALEALQPDLVVRLLDSPGDLVDRLDELGIPHFALRAETVEDARQMIRDLGFLSGRARAAEMFLIEIEAALATVREIVGPLPPVRAVFVETAGSMRVAGPGTLIHELVRSGGGVNVFADVTALFEPVTGEAIAARRPDVYLVREGAQLDPVLTRGTPVRILRSQVTVPSARLAAAVFDVARALHPEAFP